MTYASVPHPKVARFHKGERQTFIRSFLRCLYSWHLKGKKSWTAINEPPDTESIARSRGSFQEKNSYLDTLFEIFFNIGSS